MFSRDTVAVLALTLLACACEQQIDSPIDGQILFGLGEYLGEYDLRTGESDILASLGDVSVSSVRQMRDGDLLVSVSKQERDASVPLILKIDPESFQRNILLSGRAAIPLHDSDVIVYDNGTALVSTNLWRRDHRYFEISSLTGKVLVGQVAMPDGQLIVEVSDQEATRSFLYRSDPNQQVDELVAFAKTCSLGNGAVYVDDVLCELHSAGDRRHRFAFVAQDGEVVRELGLAFDNPATLVGWCPHNQVVLFTERRRTLFNGREKSALWAYDLNTDESRELADTQSLGTSIVCLER